MPSLPVTRQGGDHGRTGHAQRRNPRRRTAPGKAEIDRLLEQLLAHSHEHLKLVPEEVHWGHVGELDDWLACLRPVAKLAGVLPLDT